MKCVMVFSLGVKCIHLHGETQRKIFSKCLSQVVEFKDPRTLVKACNLH